MSFYHTPVMLEESITGLNVQPEGIYVDCTFGGGGHAQAILSELGKGRLIAFDQDEASQKNRLDDERFLLLRQNFRYLKNNLEYLGIPHVDGILADLGVSSYHFNDDPRGFSFRTDTALDMRMNEGGEKTAADVLNKYSAKNLEQVFRDYAEIRHPERLAGLIIRARERGRIRTTGDLVELLKPMLRGGKSNKFLARIFQALRMEVNEEMDALREMLEQTPVLLRRGGRLVVISYHSLEDRMVKYFMKTGYALSRPVEESLSEEQPPLRMITRKVITPSDEEITVNPRARSAKLRIAERI